MEQYNPMTALMRPSLSYYEKVYFKAFIWGNVEKLYGSAAAQCFSICVYYPALGAIASVGAFYGLLAIDWVFSFAFYPLFFGCNLYYCVFCSLRRSFLLAWNLS